MWPKCRELNFARCIIEYEKIDETIGRIMSYATVNLRIRYVKSRERTVLSVNARGCYRNKQQTSILHARNQSH